MKMHLPELLIVADRAHLTAFKPRENGTLEKVTALVFEEANLKISEWVTDQAGVFATPGGYGTGSAERLPMENEREMRCLRKIATRIRQLLDERAPLSWAFAAASEINAGILDELEGQYLQSLSLNVKANLVKSSQDSVIEHFKKARAQKPLVPV